MTIDNLFTQIDDRFACVPGDLSLSNLKYNIENNIITTSNVKKKIR